MVRTLMKDMDFRWAMSVRMKEKVGVTKKRVKECDGESKGG